jgi:hypothetical protein
MLAFVHIYKNAGTTWNAVLRRNFGIRHFDSRAIPNYRTMSASDLRAVQRFTPNLCSIGGHQVRPHSDLHELAPGIRYYTFLRHPVSRTFSAFQFNMFCRVHKGHGSWSPRELEQAFTENISRCGDEQTLHLSGVTDVDRTIGIIEERMTFTGLVEHFDESVMLFRRLIDFPTLDCRYQRLNRSSDRSDGGARVYEAMKPIDDFITRKRNDPDTLQRIQAVNENDTKLYDYTSTVHYPRLVADYGVTLEGDVQAFHESCQEANISRQDSLLAKAQRNLVLKPLRRVLFPAKNALPKAV